MKRRLLGIHKSVRLSTHPPVSSSPAIRNKTLVRSNGSSTLAEYGSVRSACVCAASIHLLPVVVFPARLPIPIARRPAHRIAGKPTYQPSDPFLATAASWVRLAAFGWQTLFRFRSAESSIAVGQESSWTSSPLLGSARRCVPGGRSRKPLAVLRSLLRRLDDTRPSDAP